MIAAGLLFPCAYGSALQDTGVVEFLDQLHLLTTTTYDENASFQGRVYKIRHDAGGVRLTFIKALGGRLKVREQLSYESGGVQYDEKITRLFLFNGLKSQPVEQVEAGDLFAVAGLSAAEAGQGLGSISDKLAYDSEPTLQSKVLFDNSIHVQKVLGAFRTLEAEEPSLNVVWDEKLQEISIRVMGLIQLEVLEQLVRERFGLAISFGQPEILYKETIQSAVKGYGHFEPLRHYAEVHLLIEPGERGSGIMFDSRCHADDLNVSYQNLIRNHLYEREHHGLLTGMPVTDVNITLLRGARIKNIPMVAIFVRLLFEHYGRGWRRRTICCWSPITISKSRSLSMKWAGCCPIFSVLRVFLIHRRQPERKRWSRAGCPCRLS